MWEVDPETRSKVSCIFPSSDGYLSPRSNANAAFQLLEIQKSNTNDRCCDCSAPSPQWASPKFGVFICLSCAGVHRGLGVHISFVRSITMDAFKAAEIERMRNGGNSEWKAFFDKHEENVMAGTTFEDATIAERYSGEVGEEWKERLSAKVEGTEWVRGERSEKAEPKQNGSQTSLGNITARNASPAMGGSPSDSNQRKAKVDDKYFGQLGAKNAARSDDLPPSQGGKYAGFGSGGAEPVRVQGAAPGLDDFQKDPVAALTKGFGWFSAAVGKTAKTVNDSYIQPTAQRVCFFLSFAISSYGCPTNHIPS